MSDTIKKYDELKQIKTYSIEDDLEKEKINIERNPKYTSWIYEMYETYENTINIINLPKPKTQVTEVLYMLLTRESINVRQMMFDTGILNLTARISDLRTKYNIDIICQDIKTKNKFERKISYGQWTLSDKEHAKEVYLKIIK